MTVEINISEDQTVSLDIGDSRLENFVELINPIIPALIKMGKLQAQVVLENLFSDDADSMLAAQKSLRENSSDAQWVAIGNAFITKANEYNQKMYDYGQAIKKGIISAAIGAIFTLLL
jgi:hypothetical protein